MGVIITDGRAGLQFKGSVVEFGKAIVGLGKLQKELGPRTLMIDTVPLPEAGGIIVRLQFNGPMSEFGKVIGGLEELRASVAIDTVPLPEKPVGPYIGTWPTPEKPPAPLRWVISARTEVG